MKYIKFYFWIFITLIVWSIVASLLSTPSDIAVVIAVIITPIYLWISWKTKCFTNFKNLYKNEKVSDFNDSACNSDKL